MEFSRRQFIRATGASIAVISLPALAAKTGSAPWTLPAKEPVITFENVWIPLSNGYKLGMRLWLPKSAYRNPVPVVLEYLPYRKRDLMRSRDDEWGYSFAPYGFAFARVDIRGTGSSDGLLLDEYLQSEQDDAVEVIAWLARQSWCNGAVGMRGISWGGFSRLSGRGDAAAGAEGDHAAVRDRQSLHGRCALCRGCAVSSTCLTGAPSSRT